MEAIVAALENVNKDSVFVFVATRHMIIRTKSKKENPNSTKISDSGV